MDFYQIKERRLSNGSIEIYPDFKVCRSKDLMVRGKSFYAIWDSEKETWSTDEYDVQRLVDDDLFKFYEETKKKYGVGINIKYMRDFSSNSWATFRKYVSNISDSNHVLDDTLTFLNTKPSRNNYSSKRLNYSLEYGETVAYDTLMNTLYSPEERDKIEWAIGAVISGDSKHIQKFLVFYGEAGAGKSTILNIIQKLFEGYYTTFDAKALTSNNNAFSTEVFRTNPLVAIQHDGDLSKIEDNTKLNSIVSHEEMTMNEKYKSSYMARTNCFLFLATNKPVKITDAKSGVIRRLIDVKPTGNKIPSSQYHSLVGKIDFELGAIAWHCLQKYNEMGKDYYSNYIPLDMILQTDVFFNFVESNYFTFKEEDSISLIRAYDMYKTYCEEAMVDFKLPRHKFRDELKNYFTKFSDMARIDGKQIRSYYSGFRTDKFNAPELSEEKVIIKLNCKKSILDDVYKDCLAQYADESEKPTFKWANVKTTLKELDTTRTHYILLSSVNDFKNHIVVDFDIRDAKGNKSLLLNLEAASKWPETYSEVSKGGEGLHLHYIYDGDVSELNPIFSTGIEIKVFSGNSSLRRRVFKCNNKPIAHIKENLPLKENKMVNFKSIADEKTLRNMIKKNLRKEIHPNTKPSIDFIHKLLNDAYLSGMHYDVSDMSNKILAFANNSSNQAEVCLKIVSNMKFKSDEPSESIESSEKRISFFDIEIFPNLFVVCWKYQGAEQIQSFINPTPEQIDDILSLKLIGFNCRRYDNHILYARYIGYTNEQLYALSKKIIAGEKQGDGMFGEAYNLSYTDIYCFSAKKQSLKKWEIELGIHHNELGFDWDLPVPEEKWQTVVDYCCDDVRATEAVFEHLAGDWAARQILADLSGLSVNDTTNSHSKRIIFGNNKNTQNDLVYTDLSEMFPGYEYKFGVSTYRGEEVGEGGYVYAEPGMYSNVMLLDVESMHPASIEALNLFGKYTVNFSALKKVRVLIKHGDFEGVSKLMDGRLDRYLTSKEMADSLSSALKIVINAVYGLTSASFPNEFKDIRNKDNIVAKRGALFMIDLKNAVQEKGYQVCHIKTDSIKIPNGDEEIKKFIMEFGEKYKYHFEHEANYDRMCLVNDAVYIAKYDNLGIQNKGGKHANEWSATGAQFAHPYVFKTLFSKESIIFDDLCETKSVNGAIYLEDLNGERTFVGKCGRFTPILPEYGGRKLIRKSNTEGAVVGTKDYFWMESENVISLGLQDKVDLSYFNTLVDKAKAVISKYGDFEIFTS